MKALDVLIEAWLATSDRPGLNAAEREIERLLTRDPENAGRYLSEELYQLTVPPLVAFYTIDLDNRTVWVTELWFTP
jgi:hypothetical protein